MSGYRSVSSPSTAGGCFASLKKQGTDLSMAEYQVSFILTSVWFLIYVSVLSSLWFFVTIGLSDRGSVLVCMSLKSGVGRLAYSHNDCATMSLAYLEGSRELRSKFLWLGW